VWLVKVPKKLARSKFLKQQKIIKEKQDALDEMFEKYKILMEQHAKREKEFEMMKSEMASLKTKRSIPKKKKKEIETQSIRSNCLDQMDCVWNVLEFLINVLELRWQK
jgi:myosin heavy subunit